jgi:hypothetical protein
MMNMISVIAGAPASLLKTFNKEMEQDNPSDQLRELLKTRNFNAKSLESSREFF